MQHYFVNAKNNEQFELSNNDINHIKNVLKMKVQINADNELNVEINVIVSLIRSLKWDLLIQKLSELGITRIIPFQEQRSIVKIKQNKKSHGETISVKKLVKLLKLIK